MSEEDYFETKEFKIKYEPLEVDYSVFQQQNINFMSNDEDEDFKDFPLDIKLEPLEKNQTYDDTGYTEDSKANLDLNCNELNKTETLLEKTTKKLARKLKKDKLAKSKKETLKCKECGAVIKNKACLKIHMKVMHSDCEVFKCNHCSYSTKYKTVIKTHISTIHGDNPQTYKCLHCEYETKIPYYLRKHIERQHSNIEILQCTLCGYKTKYKHHLRAHVFRIHEDTAETVLKCQQCSYETKDKTYLQKHVSRKHSDVIYKCKECSYKCSEKYYLKMHMLKQHTNYSEMYKCLYCCYQTKQKNKFTRHSQTVHNFTEGVCSERQASLHNQDEAISTPIKNSKHKGKAKKRKSPAKANEIFKCYNCCYQTSLKGSLIAHVRTHTEEHHCPHCSFVTVYGANLTRHLKTHKKSPLYKCSDCEYQSVHLFDIKRHAFIKHATCETLYKCFECSFEAKTKQLLASHIQQKH